LIVWHCDVRLIDACTRYGWRRTMTPDASPTLHRVTLAVSAENIRCGDATTLRWKVVGVGACVASVHLGSCNVGGLVMIESVSPCSTREVIFTQPGTFRFTLTTTFGDGTKCLCHVIVHVQP
jgi:hypothetical protein